MASLSRPTWYRLLAALVAACAALALAGAPAEAGDNRTEDERAAAEALSRAEAELEAAQRAVIETEARLEDLAGRFERAAAHATRLDDEEGGRREAVESAAALQAQVREDVSARVRALYLNPGTDNALMGAVLGAPDATTAVHRAGLVERVSARSSLVVAAAERAEMAARDEATDHNVIASGVVNAAEDLRAAADALAGALVEARVAGDRANAAVAQAYEAAEEAKRQGDLQRRAEELQRRFELTGAPPPVEGKVCPIGSPHGFIDSWGFPRSGGRSHQGIDMFAAHGMPLYAIADGTVRRVWWNRLGGLSIDLLDDNGDRYYYAHLSAAHVEAGQRVAAGQVVGANGDTGNARGTPPHLHFQFHPGDGPPINAYPLLRTVCG